MTPHSQSTLGTLEQNEQLFMVARDRLDLGIVNEINRGRPDFKLRTTFLLAGRLLLKLSRLMKCLGISVEKYCDMRVQEGWRLVRRQPMFHPRIEIEALYLSMRDRLDMLVELEQSRGMPFSQTGAEFLAAGRLISMHGEIEGNLRDAAVESNQAEDVEDRFRRYVNDVIAGARSPRVKAAMEMAFGPYEQWAKATNIEGEMDAVQAPNEELRHTSAGTVTSGETTSISISAPLSLRMPRKPREDAAQIVEESLLTLDFRPLLRDARDEGGRCNGTLEGRVEVGYEIDLNGAAYVDYEIAGERVYQLVHVISEPMPRGGHRFRVECPQCRSPALVLYTPSRASRDLGCRRCHGLKYRSQRLTLTSRLAERAKRLRLQLGDTGSLLDPIPERSETRVYSRKYERLCREYEDTMKKLSEALRRQMAA